MASTFSKTFRTIVKLVRIKFVDIYSDSLGKIEKEINFRISIAKEIVKERSEQQYRNEVEEAIKTLKILESL